MEKKSRFNDVSFDNVSESGFGLINFLIFTKQINLTRI